MATVEKTITNSEKTSPTEPEGPFLLDKLRDRAQKNQQMASEELRIAESSKAKKKPGFLK